MSFLFTFGKHRNKTIEQVPTGYIKYLLGANPSFYAAQRELLRRKDLKEAGQWKEPTGRTKA